MVAAAKFAVLAAWVLAVCQALPVVAVIAGLVIGLGLPGDLPGIWRVLLLAVMTALLGLTVVAGRDSGRRRVTACRRFPSGT